MRCRRHEERICPNEGDDEGDDDEPEKMAGTSRHTLDRAESPAKHGTFFVFTGQIRWSFSRLCFAEAELCDRRVFGYGRWVESLTNPLEEKMYLGKRNHGAGYGALQCVRRNGTKLAVIFH